MKRINTLLVFSLFLTCNVFAQEMSNDSANSIETTAKSKLQNWYVVASMGTPSLNFKDMTLKRMSSIGIGQVTVGYKLNDKVSIGIGSMGGLGNCKSGYYNAEGQFVMLQMDDDDNDEMDDDDGEDEMEDDDDDDDECETDGIGDNLMGNVTYHLTNNLFVQAAGGYGFNSKAPVYTAMVGYKHNLVCGLGIVAGLRYSDVLHKKPEGVSKIENSDGLKVELGLSWNF